MKFTLQVLLTTSILAAMYGAMPKTPSPAVRAVSPSQTEATIVIADGSDPMPGCRRCK